MPILPVLDLMHGQIVRGIAGRREEYRPIVSKLTDSAEPLAVADTLRERFGFAEFYLADLDAIQHGRPAIDVYHLLHHAGCQLWIDTGIRTVEDEAIATLIESKAHFIVGLESLKHPTDLQSIVQRVGEERTVFSLDMKAGRLLGELSEWLSDDPWRIAECAITNLGVRRLIVLDLANVGVGNGVGTEKLCTRLKRQHPKVQLTTGGGVRNIDDVKRLLDIGVDYVLVASALHDGRITPEGVRRL